MDVDGRQRQFKDQPEHVRSARTFPDKEALVPGCVPAVWCERSSSGIINFQ